MTNRPPAVEAAIDNMMNHNEMPEVVLSYIRQLEQAAPVWLPIETAPKDGTRIIVFNLDSGFSEVAWWDESEPKWKWTTADNGYLEGWCEHWQPLPTPPSADTGEAQ